MDTVLSVLRKLWIHQKTPVRGDLAGPNNNLADHQYFISILKKGKMENYEKRNVAVFTVHFCVDLY